jgi:hypothetical protein
MDPFPMIGGKTSTTNYPLSIHLESFWRIQLKITNHRTNRKGEHSAKWNFPDWTQNYLPDWHAAAASITQVAPVGVSSRWKSQIPTIMIHFGSLVASVFFVFPFRGSRLRENSVFEKMLTCGTLLNFMTTWNPLLLKQCLHVGPMSVYDVFQSLWRHKTAWNSESPATVPTVMTNVFFCH